MDPRWDEISSDTAINNFNYETPIDTSSRLDGTSLDPRTSKSKISNGNNTGSASSDWTSGCASPTRSRTTSPYTCEYYLLSFSETGRLGCYKSTPRLAKLKGPWLEALITLDVVTR